MLSKAISWIFLILTLASAYSISVFESYNLLFLAFLIFNMGFAVFYAKKIDKTVLHIGRILIGVLFIYSGIVKGVDPLGTQFKIEDYFFAYGMPWAAPYALVLSVLLNAVEFSMGALLLLKIKMKYVSVLSLLMMVMFTITTLYDALYSPVPDCGCFGDALIISNWQTFYKNIVINALIIMVFIRRSDFSEYKSKVIEYSGVLIVVFGFMFFEMYNINNLPFMDFRAWKVENRLIPIDPKPVKYFLTYENKETGATKEYLSKELPWKDSVFVADWKYASTREIDPNIVDMNTFPMINPEGIDHSKQIVAYEGYTFIFVVYDIEKISYETANEFKVLLESSMNKGIRSVVLSSDLPEDFDEFMTKYKIKDIKVYNSDDTSLKAAIRSNPGLIVVKNGEVVKKYHYNKFVDFDNIIKTYK